MPGIVKVLLNDETTFGSHFGNFRSYTGNCLTERIIFSLRFPAKTLNYREISFKIEQMYLTIFCLEGAANGEIF